jgi:hypothetical protein
MGVAWLVFISLNEVPITFINEGIQYQMPLLLVVVITKYISLVMNSYKTSKKLFYINVANYALFLLCVVFIDYRIEFFG